MVGNWGRNGKSKWVGSKNRYHMLSTVDDTATAWWTGLCLCVDIWPMRDLPLGGVESRRSSIIVISYKEGPQKRVVISTGHVLRSPDTELEKAVIGPNVRWVGAGNRDEWELIPPVELSTTLAPDSPVPSSVRSTVYCSQSLAMHELPYWTLPNLASPPFSVLSN